jgi:hypothetical protein
VSLHSLAEEFKALSRRAPIDARQIPLASGGKPKAARLQEVHAVAGRDFLVGIVMCDTSHVLEAIEGHARRTDEAGEAIHNRTFSHGTLQGSG